MPITASWLPGPLALVNDTVGEQAGVGFDCDVGLVSVLAMVDGLVDVAGVGVDGGDDPVYGDLPGDLPPAVGAVRALGRFDVLACDQREQRHRLGSLVVEFPLGCGGGEHLHHGCASLTRADTSSCLAARSSQAMFGLPGSV